MLLGSSAPPAGAHIQTLPATTYNNGTGSFVATAVANGQGCADYSNYTATLDFGPNGNPLKAEVKSQQNPNGPDFIWGEFVDGTYDTPGPNANCPGRNATHGPAWADARGSGGDDIEAFTGTLKNKNGTINCNLSSGTYTRGHYGDYIEYSRPPAPTSPPYNHPELNIAFQFSSVSGTGCPSTPVILKTTITHVDFAPEDPVLGPYATQCNSLIAPQTCQLGPQENTAAW